MSKKNEDGSYETGYADESPAGMSSGSSVSSSPGFLAIEEHAKTHNVSAPVFAAVKVMKGWNAGKKVDEWEFTEAVTAFLGSPIGGK